MKKYMVIFSSFLLAGCMSKVEPSVEKSEIVSNDTVGAAMEEGELSQKQQEIIEELPAVSTETALNNISEKYNYHHLAEQEIKAQPPIPKSTDKVGVVNYLAYGFSQFLSGKIDAKEFVETYEPFLDKSYLDLFGEEPNLRIKTMQTVYDTYYKGVPETKIAGVFISNTIVNKTADDVIVAYRRHILENGNEIFYEMGFVQNESKEWLLLDDRVSVNPYAKEKEITPKAEGEGE